MAYVKILIIGGGFGGVNAAQGLRKANVDVILIDKMNHHLFQPLLYQVATAALDSGNIAYPIRKIFRHQPNATVLMSDIVSIDKKKKQAIAANGDLFEYDYLILAVGATHSYFGHNEWEEYAPGLKTLADAIRIRERVLLGFERAETCDSLSEAAKNLRFVVIGGGPTGVEMAGAIAEISRKSLFNNFRRIRPEQSHIYLIEGLDQILPTYSRRLSDIARKNLEQLGVEVLTNSKVTNITQDGVYIGDRFIGTYNVIWAAGNQASVLLKTLDTPLDSQGRAIVGPDLSLPDNPEIFVIGDAACAMDKNGKPLPGIAPVAIQQAKYVAKILSKNIPPKDRRPFKYFDKGSMATVGKAKAIVSIGKIEFSGHFAWLAWCFLHILYLISFSNRIIVMIQWFIWYLTGQRNVRLITRSIDDDSHFDDYKKYQRPPSTKDSK